MPDEATERVPFKRSEPVGRDSEETRKPDEARAISPFTVINRGADSLGEDDHVIFSDFSPTVLPADAEELEVETVPKDESAPEPASSKESPKTTGQKKSAKTAQEQAATELAADLADGKPNPNEPS